MKTDFSQKQIDEQIRLLTKSIKQLESQKKYLQKLKADKKIYPVNPEEGDSLHKYLKIRFALLKTIRTIAKIQVEK